MKMQYLFPYSVELVNSAKILVSSGKRYYLSISDSGFWHKQNIEKEYN